MFQISVVFVAMVMLLSRIEPGNSLKTLEESM